MISTEWRDPRDFLELPVTTTLRILLLANGDHRETMRDMEKWVSRAAGHVFWLREPRTAALPALIFVLICPGPLYSSSFSRLRNSSMATPCERLLGDICLESSPANLLTEVEDLYGAPVEITETTDAAIGASGVRGHGTPYVALNPVMRTRGNIRREAAVVHELFHLKMKALGYPVLRFQAGGLRSDEHRFLLETVRLVFDPIEHRLFDPEVREMGLDPNAEIEDHFSEIEPGPQSPGFNNYYQRAITFMRVALECSRPTQLRIERIYKSNQWESALKTGKAMAFLVSSRTEFSRDDEVGIYIACLDRLLGGDASIEQVGLEHEKHGQVTYNVAILRVTHRAF